MTCLACLTTLSTSILVFCPENLSENTEDRKCLVAATDNSKAVGGSDDGKGCGKKRSDLRDYYVTGPKGLRKSRTASG